MWSRRESGLGWWSCPRWSLAPGRSWSRARESQLRRRCKEGRGRRWPGNASDRSERRSCIHTAGGPVDAKGLLGSSWRSLLPPSYWETPAASAQTRRSTKPITYKNQFGLYLRQVFGVLYKIDLAIFTRRQKACVKTPQCHNFISLDLPDRWAGRDWQQAADTGVPLCWQPLNK